MHWIDPDSLPEVAGILERFVLNRHGEVDGFVMNGQTQTPILVHTPPHMEGELVGNMKAGDKLRVRGMRPRGAHVVAAVAVTGESGWQIVDKGPDHDRKHPKIEHQKMQLEGTVRLALFGPKGELRGALLADGTIIRIGPKEAEQVAELLAPGAKIAANGDGIETAHGRVIEVRAIGTEPGSLRPVPRPKPRHDQPKPKPGHGAHA